MSALVSTIFDEIDSALAENALATLAASARPPMSALDVLKANMPTLAERDAFLNVTGVDVDQAPLGGGSLATCQNPY